MSIRKTTSEDLSKVLELYAAARLRMLDMGNPQWEFSHPTEAMVRDDIDRASPTKKCQQNRPRDNFCFLVQAGRGLYNRARRYVL